LLTKRALPDLSASGRAPVRIAAPPCSARGDCPSRRPRAAARVRAHGPRRAQTDPASEAKRSRLSELDVLDRSPLWAQIRSRRESGYHPKTDGPVIDATTRQAPEHGPGGKQAIRLDCGEFMGDLS